MIAIEVIILVLVILMFLYVIWWSVVIHNMVQGLYERSAEDD